MGVLVRTHATVVWLVLFILTLLSWALGTAHGMGAGNLTSGSLVIIAIAVFKMRLVGLYFMELRAAPRALRCLFEGYCVFLYLLLTAMYVLA